MIQECRLTFRKMSIRWIRHSNVLVERNSVVLHFSGDINVPYKCNITWYWVFFSKYNLFFNDTFSKSLAYFYSWILYKDFKWLPVNVNCWNLCYPSGTTRDYWQLKFYLTLLFCYEVVWMVLGTANFIITYRF